MMVESGFSKMKFFENDYRCNLGLEMYNAYRVVADNFDRDDFEDFEPTDSLLESVKASHKQEKELKEVDKEVEEAETKLAEAKKRKTLLELSRSGAVFKHEQDSNNVISTLLK